MFALLTVELNTCEGLSCPLNLGFLIYLIIAVISCCCCYPGSCAIPQSQLVKNQTTGKKPEEGALDKYEFFGSIGDVLKEELVDDDQVGTGVYRELKTDEDDGDFLKRRSKRIKY